MPFSALQRRIIELSCQLVATDDVTEFKQLAAQLRTALHEHVSCLRESLNETRKHLALAAAGKINDDDTTNENVHP